jgi:peptide/nickel transport system permease protein
VTGFIVRRLLQAVVVVIGVTIFTFLLQHMIPGNLARAIMGDHATSAQITAFNQEYGLNRSLPVQYWDFLNQLCHANLGYSYKQSRSVDSMVSQYLPRDIFLVGMSLILALLVAIPVGIAQAVKRNRLLDYSGTTIAFLLYSMPSYWLGLILISVFGITLHWFPVSAPQDPTLLGILSHPMALVLPIATLTLVSFALFSRYMRSSAIDSLTQDYIRTAYAKGLPRRWVLNHHLLRNSLVSIVTLVGLSLPSLLTAGLIVEYVFNFQGLGLVYYNAALTSDYPVELGITVLVGVATVVGNLMADVGYAILDPRVRYRTTP